MIIEISGHSDDIIQVALTRAIMVQLFTEDLEFSLNSSGVTTLNIKCAYTQQTCRVVCVYGETGCWHFAPAFPQESSKLPPWKFMTDNAPESEYSTRLTIDTGEDRLVEVTVVW